MGLLDRFEDRGWRPMSKREQKALAELMDAMERDTVIARAQSMLIRQLGEGVMGDFVHVDNLRRVLAKDEVHNVGLGHVGLETIQAELLIMRGLAERWSKK